MKTFKVPNEPGFEEKLHEVVVLYRSPPERAIVLCVDEKSQIQVSVAIRRGCQCSRGGCKQ